MVVALGEKEEEKGVGGYWLVKMEREWEEGTIGGRGLREMGRVDGWGEVVEGREKEEGGVRGRREGNWLVAWDGEVLPE